MTTQDDAKRLVARAALELLPASGVIGLGSGSTATLFIDGVGELVKQGRKLSGVPTSDASRAQATRLGIPLLDDAGPWVIDVCVDGADEVSAALDLIKGGGGAHTREKIVNQAARTNVIVVDESKLSERLGEKWPIPVEVLPFGRLSTVAALAKLTGGARVELRQKPGSGIGSGVPWMTDAGNFLYDVYAGILSDPGDLESRLSLIPGVVDTGLFVGRADIVLVAGKDGIQRLERKE